MKSIIRRAIVLLDDGAARMLGLLRLQWIRALGVVVGGIAFALGAALALQNSDPLSAMRALGLAGSTAAVALSMMATALGALGWAAIVSAVVPDAGLGPSLRAHFAALPLKYFPGSIWNHAGKAVWLTQANRQANALVMDRAVSSVRAGAMGVALDFGLSLWSGFVLTVLLAWWRLPRVLAGILDPIALSILALVMIAVTLAAPFGIYALRAPSSARHAWAFASRLWAAQALQMLSWAATSALLLVLTVALIADTSAIPGPNEALLALFSGILSGLAAPFVPNGMGVREWVIGLALPPGTPIASGIAAAIFHRIIIMLGELLIFSFFSLTSLQRSVSPRK